MRRRRMTPTNLSAGERRVLDAFSCGRIAAGRLSQALAEARQQPAPALPAAARTVRAVPDPQATVEVPAALPVAA